MEKESNADRAWRSADNADMDNLPASLLRRLCGPERRSSPHAGPPPQPRSRGEQSEKSMFSCSNVNARFCVHIDGIQALNSALHACGEAARASSLVGQPGILPGSLVTPLSAG